MAIFDDDYLKKYDIISIISILEGSITPKINIKYKDGKIFSFIISRTDINMFDLIDYHVNEQYVLSRTKKIEKITKKIWKNQK